MSVVSESSSDTSFIFVKDDKDLTEYALDFMEDESSYYDVIKSYTTEDKLALFICVNGIVCSGAYYDEDGEVDEYFRFHEPFEKKFSSIKDWYDDCYGEVASIDKVLNNVFIGEDLVPLWKVLVDAMEEESESESSDDETDFNTNPQPLSMNQCDWILVYSFVTINAVSLLGILLVSVFG